MNLHSNDNICRICLKRQDTLFSLFRNLHGTSPYQKLLSKTNLKIELNDSGPSSICSQCLIDLDTTVTFLEKCEFSNHSLAAMLQRSEDSRRTSKSTNCLHQPLQGEVSIASNPVAHAGTSNIIINTNLTNNDMKQGVEPSCVPTVSPECSDCDSKRRCAHWTPPSDYLCQFCDKIFNKKYNYQIHLKRHRGERDCLCPKCGAPQLTESLAKRHCQPKVLRQCPIPGCSKAFTNNSNLQIHIRSHSGERPFECHDCSKRFTSKKTLRDHIRIHTGEKPYMCVVCGVRFTSNHMSVHMRTHAVAGRSEPHRHACPRGSCARAFHTAGALRSHLRTHAALRPFTCALCTCAYKFKQSLNRHVRKRHGVISPPLTTDDR